jgi:anti-sigma factor RsiW
MNCRDAEPLLHARLDNELDVAGAITVDRHLSDCRACAAQYDALQNLKQEIAAAQPAYALPPRLERKLTARFTSRGTLPARFWSRPWQSTIALAGAAACIAALVMFLPMMRSTDGTNAIAAEILDKTARHQPLRVSFARRGDQTGDPELRGLSSAPLGPGQH